MVMMDDLDDDVEFTCSKCGNTCSETEANAGIGDYEGKTLCPDCHEPLAIALEEDEVAVEEMRD